MPLDPAFFVDPLAEGQYSIDFYLQKQFDKFKQFLDSVAVGGETSELYSVPGYTTTVTAAGTTTLTAESTDLQRFTGATTETLVLPDVTTLTLGRTFRIVNESTGSINIQSSGLNNLGSTIQEGQSAMVTCVLLTGTDAASWLLRLEGGRQRTGNGAALVYGGSPTFTGVPVFPAGVSGGASLRVPHGTAPSSPTDGDVWTTSAGLFVRVNGVTIGPLVDSAPDLWTYVILGSDFTISTTANNSVTGLAFTPAASETYEIEGLFLLRTSVTTTGARPGVAWPTGYSDGAVEITAPNSNTAFATQLRNAGTTANAASTGLPATTASYLGKMKALMVMGGSPSGNFQVTLASETAAVDVTMKAGSFIRYRTI